MLGFWWGLDSLPLGSVTPAAQKVGRGIPGKDEEGYSPHHC